MLENNTMKMRYAFFIVFGTISTLLNIVGVFLLLKILALMLAIITANVAVFIPPAEDAGEPPINIKITHSKMVNGPIAPKLIV